MPIEGDVTQRQEALRSLKMLETELERGWKDRWNRWQTTRSSERKVSQRIVRKFLKFSSGDRGFSTE
jgi:hypothetical protein